MSDCPQCGRPAPIATYTCRVPGCLEMRFCCPACICKHMGEHVKERDERIWELEKAEKHWAFKHGVCKGMHHITTDQIRAAWKRMNRLRNSENNAEHFMGRGIEAALKQDFCIVRCGGCNGYGSLDGNPFDDDSEPDNTCPDCNGEGFVIGGEDE